jgi:hypothetical protein
MNEANINSSARLEILKNSLLKKQKKLDNAFSNHFDDVKSANGQPLNDKRNGCQTMSRWDRQSDSIRNLKQEVEKTERAIEREEEKLAFVSIVNDELPEFILSLVQDGVLKQWRKHPHIFFVDGVNKARLVYDTKNKKIMYNYLSAITCKDQYKKFAQTFNMLNREISNQRV